MADSAKDKASKLWDDAQDAVNDKKKDLSHKFYEEKGRVEQRSDDQDAIKRNDSTQWSDDSVPMRPE